MEEILTTLITEHFKMCLYLLIILIICFFILIISKSKLIILRDIIS